MGRAIAKWRERAGELLRQTFRTAARLLARVEGLPILPSYGLVNEETFAIAENHFELLVTTKTCDALTTVDLESIGAAFERASRTRLEARAIIDSQGSAGSIEGDGERGEIALLGFGFRSRAFFDVAGTSGKHSRKSNGAQKHEKLSFVQ